MKRCLVGVVSWCDSSRFPERFKVFKKTVASIQKYVPKNECIIAIIDNHSSEDVQAFIEASDIFDHKIILPENIHDVGAYGVLAHLARDLKLDYIWVLENDYVLFKPVPIKSLMTFLKKHPEVGYIRTQKFEFNQQQYYDKSQKHAKVVEKGNTVWLKNIETEEDLIWHGPYKTDRYTMYINNWHFGMHGGIIPLSVWEKIYPREVSMPYYYKLEKAMRHNFTKYGFQVGVLDGGVFSMEAPSVYQAPEKNINGIEQKYKPIELPGGFIEDSKLYYYFHNYHKYYPTQIQLFGNSLGQEELQALKRVFESHWLGYGPESKKFESKFADMLGAKYALGISSCTAGLFMSMEILGVKPGDEVIIPSVGFIGCANAVIKAGAKPVFVDVDKQYFNISPTSLENAITDKTKAVIVLHYGGIPCDMRSIRKILKKQNHKIYLIEDSANSIKSLYYRDYCGTLGDIGLFSLDANKIMTTGTGGVLTTNDDNIYQKAKVTRFYGLKPSQLSGYDAMKAKKERWWEIELEYPGNRYLINDITSAIALAQMEKLDVFIGKRKKIWHYYQTKLKSISGIKIPKEPPKNTKSSYYFYWVQVQNEYEQLSLANHLTKNGIYTSFRYYPLHLISYYRSNARLSVSEEISKKTLNLPLHQNLSKKDLDRIIYTVKDWAQHKKSEVI